MAALGAVLQSKGSLPDDLEALTLLVTNNPFLADPKWGDLGWRVEPLPEGEGMVLRAKEETPYLGFWMGKKTKFNSFYLAKQKLGGGPVISMGTAHIAFVNSLKEHEQTRERVSDGLLGEFRMEGGRGTIIPAIKVTTATGVDTIPVGDVVEFVTPETLSQLEPK